MLFPFLSDWCLIFFSACFHFIMTIHIIHCYSLIYHWLCFHLTKIILIICCCNFLFPNYTFLYFLRWLTCCLLCADSKRQALCNWLIFFILLLLFIIDRIFTLVLVLSFDFDTFFCWASKVTCFLYPPLDCVNTSDGLIPLQAHIHRLHQELHIGHAPTLHLQMFDDCAL